MTFEFLKMDKELIVIYTPFSGANEIRKKIETSDGYNIKNVFWVEKNLCLVTTTSCLIST